jgi:hypothetical protein
MINTTNSRDDYVGAGIITPIPISFQFLGLDDIEVIERNIATGVETTKINGVDYIVSGGNGNTGSALPTLAVPVGVTWTIRRVTPFTQRSDYITNDRFPAETHERRLDHLTLIAQELREQMSRALQLPKAEPIGNSPILPPAPARLDGVQRYDAGTGAPFIGQIGAITIDNSGVVVVSSVDPGHIVGGGRIWVDVSVAAQTSLRLDDGVDWILLFTVDEVGNIISASPALAVMGQSNTFTAQQFIVRSGTLSLDLESTSSGSSEGPILKLRRNKIPVVNDKGGEIRWEMKNSVGVNGAVASIEVNTVDPTSGSEDFELEFWVEVAGGGNQRKMSLGGGLYMRNAVGGDKGVGSINASAPIYVNNSQLPTGLADAATMEAGVSTALAVTPGLQPRHPLHPKAVARFNGTGSPALAFSSNISLLSDNGVGDFTLTFITANADALYGAVGLFDAVVGASLSFTGINANTILAGSFRLNTFNNTPAVADGEFTNLLFFGDRT